MRILTIVPCYNAERYIGEVIKSTKKFNKNILVVDDGSTDNSYNILKKIKGINIIQHSRNKGKGAALKAGFGYALKNNFDAVITIDADGQHKPEDIPNFLMNFNDADIILGNRMNNIGNMPLVRILANIISSYIISSICKQQINDSQSGYRLIKNKILKDIDLDRDDYHMETELLLKAAKRGYKIGEVPIKAVYGGEGMSHIKPLLVPFKFISTIARRGK